MLGRRVPRGRLGTWLQLLGLSFRVMPGMTTLAITALLVSTLILPATALAMKAVTNAITDPAPIVVMVSAAFCAALACAVGIGVEDATTLVLRTAGDRLGRLHVHPEVHRTISEMVGIEHLERSDYLDRVVIVRGGTSPLAGFLWNSASAVASIAKVGLTAALLAAQNPVLILLAVFAAVPGYCFERGQRAVQRIELATAQDFRQQQHLFELVTDASSFKEIRLGGSASWLLERQSRTWNRLHRRRVRGQAIAAAWTAGGWLVFVLGFVGALFLVTAGAASGHGGVGDIVLTVVVASALQSAIATAVASVGSTFNASRVIQPFIWLSQRADADGRRRRATLQPPTALEQGMALRDVGFRYSGNDRDVLSNVDLEIPAGTVVAIVGEYGSGKTTLVKLLARFYDPTTGTIELEGKDLSTYEPKAWRARTTAAYQDFGKFHVTFRESVGLGDVGRIDDDRAVREAVVEADAESIVSGLPKEIDTQLGVELGGVGLSEGEWQRVALARAAMRDDPLLLILDEPTASIDAPTEERVFQRFMRMSRRAAARTGAITVLVSHRFSTVTGADVIVVMDKGRIVEMGTHRELLERGGRYAEMFRLQVEAYAR